MKKIINILIIAGVVVSLTGCGSSPSSSPDANNTDTNKTEALVGGTADHPKELEFDKPYLVTQELGKQYVKVSVDKYQRIVIERKSDDKCVFDPFEEQHLYFSTLYDNSLQYKPLYAFGVTQDRGSGEKNGVHDIIFLKGGIYIFEYSFPPMYRDYCTKILLTARNIGISPLKKIQNKGNYSDHNFYLLEMKNDGVVNFKGGDGTLYDEDLNIIENIDLDSNTPDINVSLSQGNYLLRPGKYENITVTLNP